MEIKRIRHDWLILLIAFSVSYAFVEYYLVRDTTFGSEPILFSLIYPYHIVMAGMFGIAAYSLLIASRLFRNFIHILVALCALFSSMLAIEDFTWFTLRAIAPLDGDTNAGRLVLHGEWTTQFMGSTDAYFTAIPNWYFFGPILSVASAITTQVRRKVTTIEAY